MPELVIADGAANTKGNNEKAELMSTYAQTQEQGEHNAIFFRALDSEDRDSKKRKQYDNKYFNELCNDVLEIGTLDIEDITRFIK